MNGDWGMNGLRVGIIFGGPSAEHTVSCSSAASLLRSLPEGLEPVMLGIDRDGGWRLIPAATVRRVQAGSSASLAIEDRIEVEGEPVELRADPLGAGAVVVAQGEPGRPLTRIDVAFPVLHGPFGEDGVLQGYLETLGVPYVGCGVLGSAVGMDKVAMKRALAADGVPITPHVWFDRWHWRGATDLPGLSDVSGLSDASGLSDESNLSDGSGLFNVFGLSDGSNQSAGLADLVADLHPPYFVKPANMGSSLGISMVSAPDGELTKAVEEAFGYDDVVLIEQGVPSPRELEAGVLGGDHPIASPVGEVAVRGGWFDHEQKYFGTADPMTVPADLPDGVAERVQELSLRAFRAIGGWGLARVDFLYDQPADRLYVNELNTMPGFTAHSMFPKVWAAGGLAYPDLVLRLVELALQRHARRIGRFR